MEQMGFKKTVCVNNAEEGRALTCDGHESRHQQLGRLLQEADGKFKQTGNTSGDGFVGSQGLFVDEKPVGTRQNKKGTAIRRELRELIQMQGYRCALSGVELQPDTASLDHVIPVSQGGGHDVGNLQVLHKDINRMKGTLSHEDFIQWCRLVVDTTTPAGY